MEEEYDEGCTCKHTPRQHFTMPGLPATAMVPCLVDGCPCLDYQETPLTSRLGRASPSPNSAWSGLLGRRRALRRHR